MLGAGISSLLGQNFIGIRGLSIKPWLFSFDPLMIFLIALVPCLWFMLFKTRYGIIIRSVGENPTAADAIGVNVNKVRYLCTFFGGLLSGLAGAYLSVPTRPPAEERAQSPGEYVVARAYQVFSERLERVEVLTGYEGNAFAFTGNVEEDMLSITAVHPMREGAVRRLIERDGRDWEVVEDLLQQGRLVEARYGTHRYFLRPLKEPTGWAPEEGSAGEG